MEGMNTDQKITIGTILEEINRFPVGLFLQAVIGFGFLVLMIHFFSIGYLPTFSLSSLLTLIYAVGVTGLITALSSCLLLVIPGVIWSVSLSDIGKRLFLRHKTSEGVRSLRLVPKAVVFHFISGYILYIPLLQHAILKNAEATWLSAISTFLLFVALNLIVLRARYQAPLIRYRPSRTIFWMKQLFNLLKDGIFLGAFSYFAFYLIAIALQNSFYFQSLALSLFVIFILLGMSALTNLAFAVSILARHRIEDGYRFSLAMLSIFLLVLISITASWDSLPNYVVRHLRLGSIPNVKLLVTHEACVSVNKVLGKNNCTNDGPTIFEPMTVLSNIGDELYLETKVEQKRVRFTLPRSQLVSLITEDPIKNP